jgi:hypothetical protein
MGQAIPNKKKTFYRQVLKLGANEASAQGLQNALSNECHAKSSTESWAFEDRDLALLKVTKDYRYF